MSTIKANTIQPTLAGNNLIFANGSAVEKMRITDDGLVGMGASIPAAKLHIKTPAVAAGSTSLADMNLLSKYSLVLDATSAVGLGSTPNYNGAGIAFTAANSSPLPFASIFYGGDGSGGSLHFATSYTYANGLNKIGMSIRNGNVGIGITGPSVALDVAGEARTSIGTTAGSNAKTLVTKDYVDGGVNGTRIGTIIVFSGITFQTAYDRFGITHTAGTNGTPASITLPTGTWNGFVIKDSGGNNVVQITQVVDRSGIILIGHWDNDDERISGVITRTS